MAWPTSTTQELALSKVDAAASSLKNRAIAIRNASLAGDISRLTPLVFVRDLTAAINVFNEASSVPGIVQYARDQKGNQGIDVVAEFSAMVNAATACKDWVNANIPTGAQGAVLLQTHDGQGNLADMVFTSAQLAVFRTQLDALIATIG